MDSDDYKLEHITLPEEAHEAARLYHEAKVLAQAGQFEEAVARANAIQQTNFRLWWAFRNEALIGVSRECAQAGQIDRALEIKEMIASQYQSGALFWIVLACDKHGQHERAIELAKSITDESVRTHVLSRLQSLKSECP